MKIPVKEFLNEKGARVRMINKNETVYNALVRMAKLDIGALLVEDNNKLVGIFSERDYARKVILKGKKSRKSTVGEMMSSELTVVGPETTMRECMTLMLQKKIRHIPVIDQNKLIGLVSIGDVVDRIMIDQEAIIHELEEEAHAIH